ncbi:MAG: Nif3-like dinuclear metal center hexameric protein, partial [Gloeomargaritaceae cyanobacterium C42_A2020_066]|nr:Nif3-like dinuclear metal center hexameric protein [Gloeomargaritaceae cyanobacterium C42_A2020_066]
NCGWQVEPDDLGRPARVLVCLTPTLPVLHEAIDQGANLILAHHPLVFKPLKALRRGNPVAEVLGLAWEQGMGIYTAHTNFDQAEDGTADVLAQVLNLQDPVPFVPTPAGPGYGRVGNLPQPVALSTFLDQVRQQLQVPQLLHAPLGAAAALVNRVAVLGGSGAGFVAAAGRAGAQVYVTADAKFHQFQEAQDWGVVLVDAGHYGTERPACGRWVDKLTERGVEWVALSQTDEDFRVMAG